MSREPMPLVGLIEIAMCAGVKRNTVTSWIDRYEDFPEPVAKLAVGPVFWWPAVQAWLARTGRRWDAGWTREQVTHAFGNQKVEGRVTRWARKLETGSQT